VITFCTITTSYNTESGQLILVKIRMTLPVSQLLLTFRVEKLLLSVVVNFLLIPLHVSYLTMYRGLDSVCSVSFRLTQNINNSGLVTQWSWGSSASIVSWLQTERPGFDPQQGQRIFPLTSVSRLALRPDQPPIQWVLAVLFPGVKHGQGVGLTTHPSAKVKNE
jgi:hypothetical protein